MTDPKQPDSLKDILLDAVQYEPGVSIDEDPVRAYIEQVKAEAVVAALEGLKSPIVTTVEEVLEADNPTIPFLQDILNLIDQATEKARKE